VHERRHVEQIGEFRQLLSFAHLEERAVRAASSRSAVQCMLSFARLFTASDPGQVVLRLGTGARRSAVGVGGSQPRPSSIEQQLAAEAAILIDAPVTSVLPRSLAIVGPLPLARAVARGIVLQVASTLEPAGGVFLGPVGGGSSWDWLRVLPHHGVEVSVLIRDAPGSNPSPLAAPVRRSQAVRYEILLVESPDDVPAECRLTIHVDSGSRSVVQESDPAGSCSGELSPEFVSEHQARLFAAELAARARSRPSGPGMAGLPRVVGLAGLLTDSMSTSHVESRERGLSVPLGSDGRSSVMVDLVSQGPHAVVGGTTGSGKSELLLSWVTGLVCRYSAAEVTVLLVDFKGGAAFDPFTHLEQCVGLITDLDSREAARALGSLRAEIRRREQLLRGAGARDIADYRGQEALPRLVIVVDEFAVMLNEFPDLHDLFVDIAARGRSLGMHLILCTQRPVGVIRDTLLANCDLRLSLRVNNAADSTALIGVPDASGLDAEDRGRCFIAGNGKDARLFQVARAAPAQLSTARRLGRSVRRPWLEPLPMLLDLDVLREEARVESDASVGVVFGRFDRPSEQAQPLAHWRPQEDGPLLVLGAGRSGRSSLLAAIASGLADVWWIPAERAEAWDRLSRLFDGLSAGRFPPGLDTGHPLVVIIDDLDSLLAAFEPEYQVEVVRWLTAMLREGARHGLVLLASAQRVAAPLSSVAPLFAERILLRAASRAEYLLTDANPADYDPMLAPGEGFWSGTRLKVARAANSLISFPVATSPDAHGSANLGGPDGCYQPSNRILIVSAIPRGARADRGEPSGRILSLAQLAIDLPRPTADDVASHGDSSTLSIIGDPEEWLNHWALFGALRATFDVLFEGCTIADYRALTRRRDLPPPSNPGVTRRWLLSSAGVLSRAEMAAER
jgi:S-DNA-T family DNA segregation ATPase FtsK/SpoIIIE